MHNQNSIFFECGSASTLAETLAAACQKAKGSGNKSIIGPINTNTWYRYRLLERDFSEESLPPFGAEPYDRDYKEQLEILAESRFTVAARYHSSIFSFDSSAKGKPHASNPNFFSDSNFYSDYLFQALLAEIYALSCLAFADNYLYQAISFDAFSKLYLPLENIVKDFPPVLCRSQSSGELLGYCLVLPYLKDTILFKTIARKPGAQFAGMGRAMVEEAILRYSQKGYSKGVFALYKDDGSSRYMQDCFGARVFRSYALFSRHF
ncbi:MAG: hypothetical protein K2Y32_18695 [Candidatus Obscuribacterales bacterium]|nr:hypothetical protein [Candidatus Obscuribacterales bacterium]